MATLIYRRTTQVHMDKLSEAMEIATEQAKLESNEKIKVLEVVTKLAGMVNSDNRDKELKGMEMLMELAKIAEDSKTVSTKLPARVDEIINIGEIES